MALAQSEQHAQMPCTPTLSSEIISLTPETPLLFPWALCLVLEPHDMMEKEGAPQPSPRGLDKPLPMGQGTTSTRQQSCPFSKHFVVRPAPA